MERIRRGASVKINKYKSIKGFSWVSFITPTCIFKDVVSDEYFFSLAFYFRVPLETFACTAAVFMICPGRNARSFLQFSITKRGPKLLEFRAV